MIRAVEGVFPHSLRLRITRCAGTRFHKLRNGLAKLLESVKEEALAHLRAIWDAPAWTAGAQLAASFTEQCRFGPPG